MPTRLKLKRLLRWTLIAAAAFYAWILVSLLLMRWITPPTTAVQLQRRVESWFARGTYIKRRIPVSLSSISPALQHAVIAAEDGSFYRHSGFDWEQLEAAIDEATDDGPGAHRIRGASTITQQLVKNLFLTTHGSFLRKGLEFTIVPLAELTLNKKRILELYLNVIEWGPGIYGAEAAARHHYRVPAARISRDQGARLAAILPSPRRRQPARMHRYSAIILQRMEILGW